MRYESWCALSEQELASRDIAEVNLAAAFSLPGAEAFGRDRSYIDSLRQQLDNWADMVDATTRRILPTFRQRTECQDLSASQFRMLALVTVLQRDLGVRYNPAMMEDEYNASDSRDLFIHGILQGRGGTCASLPVLYAAIGRRLGYPLKLVYAKEHLLVRWDDGAGDRFNVEATSTGYVSHDDNYYHRQPRPLSDDEIRCGRFLIALTPRQELAAFLVTRGACWLDNGKPRLAVESFYFAKELDSVHLMPWLCASVISKVCADQRFLDAPIVSTGRLDERLYDQAFMACVPAEVRHLPQKVVDFAREDWKRVIRRRSRERQEFVSIIRP